MQDPKAFVIIGNEDDTLNSHRAQRLVREFGLTDRRARIVASLFWGGAHV